MILSNERCFQELKAEGTSDVSHGIAKGLAVGPCHTCFASFLTKTIATSRNDLHVQCQGVSRPSLCPQSYQVQAQSSYEAL